MSYKPVVRVGSDPKWYDNALRFASEEEARDSARDLHGRWMLTTAYGAEPSDDPVNYVREHGRDVRIADPVPASREPNTPAPLARLRYHVTGAIERGEAEAITEVRDEPKSA